MNPFLSYFDILLHLDKQLALVIAEYGVLTYLILFIIIFGETGLVFLPFLPGDSLLFVAGTLAAVGSLNIAIIIPLLSISAILGDTVNYHIGKFSGKKMLHKYPNILKQEYIDKTNDFYNKHGGKTIVIARFIPIVRTFAPFVAGIGKMDYKQFLLYNIFGGIFWISFFILLGYFFGNIPFVKNNLTIFILIIIVLSAIPVVIEFLKHRKK